VSEYELERRIYMLEGELDNAYQNMHDDRKLFISDLMEIRQLVTALLNEMGYNPDASINKSSNGETTEW
jgi:hypothetical protein